MVCYMEIHVYSILAKKEQKEKQPPLTHTTQTDPPTAGYQPDAQP